MTINSLDTCIRLGALVAREVCSFERVASWYCARRRTDGRMDLGLGHFTSFILLLPGGGTRGTTHSLTHSLRSGSPASSSWLPPLLRCVAAAAAWLDEHFSTEEGSGEGRRPRPGPARESGGLGWDHERDGAGIRDGRRKRPPECGRASWRPAETGGGWPAAAAVAAGCGLHSCTGFSLGKGKGGHRVYSKEQAEGRRRMGATVTNLLPSTTYVCARRTVTASSPPTCPVCGAGPSFLQKRPTGF